MKKLFLCFIVCLLILCGCSSANDLSPDNYDIGYEEGYEDGYNDALEKSSNNPDYSEELHSFQAAIADLMYDHEYDTVKKLMEYNSNGVKVALEIEFGSSDIDVIIDYIDKLSKTITGTCEICGNPVYADDFAILPEGITCAHSKCVA